MLQSTMWEPAGKANGEAIAAEHAHLARLRRQVDERWRTLALAHERASAFTPETLDRLYDAYMRAVDAYVTRQRALSRGFEAQRRAS